MKTIALLITLFLFSPLSCLGAQPLDIVINEIAWMGTEKRLPNDEWIELFNNTNNVLDIDGWKIAADDGSPEILLGGNIEPKGFFILERTNDETMPETKADLIYKGGLNNKGEYLQLFDRQGNLIDSVQCQDGWLYGDNETKQTMERKDSLLNGDSPDNWQTSQASKGSPKKENSLGAIKISPQEKDESSDSGNQGGQALELKPDKLTGEIFNALPTREAIGNMSGSFVFVFFAALISALFAGALILVAKKTIK